jgi:hypothetical protein
VWYLFQLCRVVTPDLFCLFPLHRFRADTKSSRIAHETFLFFDWPAKISFEFVRPETVPEFARIDSESSFPNCVSRCYVKIGPQIGHFPAIGTALERNHINSSFGRLASTVHHHSSICVHHLRLSVSVANGRSMMHSVQRRSRSPMCWVCCSRSNNQHGRRVEW